MKKSQKSSASAGKIQNYHQALPPGDNSKFKSFFWPIAFFLVLVLPVLVSAQIIVNPREPVPVPINTAFGCAPGLGGVLQAILIGCGPAGQLTATGVIIAFIQIGLAVAGTLAVLFVIVGGIRYISAHGNEEQAEAAKKTLTHAILGIVIVVLSFVIIRIITNALIFGGGPLGT